ncbi:hypothetical protein LSTR_LSTR006914 [Laodelphax striatellus]|uniref:Uncharacterized protein n=1 Tax=Laodelphax striatellus TaxID=195883 RepID=A0A482X333_LAOST|nr:hypothetical protein LSTR_LSTR006914 [Laodelphax striatellus]
METCQVHQRLTAVITQKSVWSSVVMVLAAWVSCSAAISVPTGKVGPITPYRPPPPTANPNAPRNPAPVVEYSQDNPEPPPLDPSYLPYSYKTLNALSGNSLFYVPLRIRNAYQEHPNGFSSYYPETPQTDYVTYKGTFNYNQKPVNFNVPIKEFDYASLKRKPIIVAPLPTNNFWQNQQYQQPTNQVYQQQQTSQQYNQYQQPSIQAYQPQQPSQQYNQYQQPSNQAYQPQQTSQQYQQTPQQYQPQQTSQQVSQTQQYPVQNQSSQVQRQAPANNDSAQTQSDTAQQKLYEGFSSQKIQDQQKQSNYPSQKKKAAYTKGQYQTEQQYSQTGVEKKPTSIYPKKAVSEQSASKYSYYVKQN